MKKISFPINCDILFNFCQIKLDISAWDFLLKMLIGNRELIDSFWDIFAKILTDLFVQSVCCGSKHELWLVSRVGDAR